MSIEIILHSSEDNNYIVTTAIGKKYYDDFLRYSFNSWEKYCKKYGIGLAVVVRDIISKTHFNYKKANWQKFIVAAELRKVVSVKNICHLDTDILISPIAPNIFDFHEKDYISVVSKRKNLPYSLNLALKRIAFLRNHYYSPSYPLDSSLFISLNDLYSFHNLENPSILDETCSGVFVYNVDKFEAFFEDLFHKYDKDIKSLSNGGDQTHFNFHVLNGPVKFLDYKFQSLWTYEQAVLYPFIYDSRHKKSIKSCIQASLMNNYFLHFAGSWHESNMWKMKNIIDKSFEIICHNFSEYEKKPQTGKPLGQVKP